ncbi:MAG: DUF177 domain-containing protein, partial [Clostridia bacterium]|nr:DUF177 domain-containing protein [Clostridia bacterium]
MRLDVSQAFKKPGERIAFRHEEAIPPQQIFSETVTFDDPAVFEGTYLLEGRSLYLSGSFHAVAHGHCAYCLQPVEFTVDQPFDEIFLQVDRFTELNVDEEDERWTFEGKEIDLAQLALTLAVLELPIRFECAECENDDPDDDPDPET